MTNSVSNGEVLNYIVPSGGVSSGDLVEVGGLVGVAVVDGVENDTVAVNLKGCYEVAKVTADAVTQGQALYIDSGELTTTVGSNVLAGYAAEAASDSVSIVKVILK